MTTNTNRLTMAPADAAVDYLREATLLDVEGDEAAEIFFDSEHMPADLHASCYTDDTTRRVYALARSYYTTDASADAARWGAIVDQLELIFGI